MDETETSKKEKNEIVTLFFASVISTGLWWLPFYLSEKVDLEVSIFDPLPALGVGLAQFLILLGFMQYRHRKHLGLNMVLTLVAIISGRGMACLGVLYYWVAALLS